MFCFLKQEYGFSVFDHWRDTFFHEDARIGSNYGREPVDLPIYFIHSGSFRCIFLMTGFVLGWELCAEMEKKGIRY